MPRLKAFWLLASLAAYFAAQSPARAEEPVRILATGVFATSLESLAQPFESASGHKLHVSIANAGEVARRVVAGEAADLVMTSSAGIKTLAQQNVLAPNEVLIGKMRLGVAVRSGAAMPDLGSTEALRTLLRSTATILVIARSFAAECLRLAGWANQIAADFSDDR